MTFTSIMSGPSIGELFTGYGGLGMAVQQVFPDAEVVWTSDIESGPCKVLAHHHPHAPNLGDITKIDWATVPRVNILTGGFPCQDVSHAGKQAGLIAGSTRTGLWAHMLAGIDALRPDLVIAENVRGLLSARGDAPSEDLAAAEATVRAATNLLAWITTVEAITRTKGPTHELRNIAARRLRIMECRRRAVARAKRAEARTIRAIGTVLGTLADIGYHAIWTGLPAAGVGAPPPPVPHLHHRLACRRQRRT